MLKEKVRLGQPTSTSRAQTKETASATSLVDDASQSQSQPKPGLNRVSSSTFRRATFKPQRSASVTSNNDGVPRSNTVNSRASSSTARNPSQTSRESVPASRASSYSVAPQPQSSELPPAALAVTSPMPTPPMSVFSPISNTSTPLEESFAGIGKRKRAFEEEPENQRPSAVEAVVVPPSSPSRFRQMAERGLRKLSPKKKFAQLMDEADAPTTNPFAPVSFDDAGPSLGRERPEERPSSVSSQSRAPEAQVPTSRRTRPGASSAIRPRVRLQDMLSGGR